MEFRVNLNEIEKVHRFAKLSEQYEADIIVKSIDRKYQIDGSSLMGLFNLDLSKSVIVSVEDEEIGEALKKEVADCAVK